LNISSDIQFRPRSSLVEHHHPITGFHNVFSHGTARITIKGGGHFLQEDCGAEFAKVIVDFIARTSKSAQRMK